MTSTMEAIYPDGDLEFEEYLVREVKFDADAPGCHVVVSRGGVVSFVPPPGSKVAEGSKIRLYGRGLDSPIRGLFVDGIKCFYRTEAEDAAHREGLAARQRDAAVAEHERTKDALEARRLALPPALASRIERMRRNSPTFAWRFEKLELFVCEQAAAIAARFRLLPKRSDVFRRFLRAEPHERLRMVPGLSRDHDDVTMGASVGLANLLLNDPLAATLAHGAMAAAVGCEAYGCHVKSEEARQ